MGYVTPASQSTISYNNIYESANFSSPGSDISASVLMKQSWPKGPYGDSTYPYTGWGTSGSYNYANRLCGTPSQPTTQYLGKFFDKMGTCTDSNAFPYYSVQYDIDVLFGVSDTITDVTFKITDSLTTTTLVSDYQADLNGPGLNVIGPLLLSTESTPNVQNCYWTLDFYCDYRTVSTGSMRGFCDANNGAGEQLIFGVNPILDGTTYNLEYTTTGYAPSASLTGSTGGGFVWRFEFG